MTNWSEEIDVAHGGVWRLQLLMERVLFEGRSDFQRILVFENRLFGRVLSLDGIIQMAERDEFFYHEMAIQVPMLAHGAVKRALIIGGGDGGALEEMLKHPGLESVTMVEIDAMVVELAKQHLRATCKDAFEDPRTNLIIADGVQYLAESAERFDFILIDSTDPIGFAGDAPQGPGAVLFSEAFYRSCKACMNPGAVLVTQNAVPFVEEAGLSLPIMNLRRIFAAVDCYRVAVPSFFGGDMVFVQASDDPGLRAVPFETLAARTRQAALETRYYTPEIHRGAFDLPGYLVKLIG